MRLPYLDGLRCIAVLAVVAQHYLESLFPKVSKPFLELGPGVFGVALFFMISGYVIPMSLANTPNWRVFWIRRLLRILPMFWVTLLVVLLMGVFGLTPYSELVHGLYLWDLITNALLLFEFAGSPGLLGVSWSLSLEFVWYGMICVLLMSFKPKRLAYACMAFSGFLIVVSLLSVGLEQRPPFGRLLMLNAALLGFARFCFENRLLSERGFILTNLAFILCAIATLMIGFGFFEHPRVSLASNATAWITSYVIFSVTCGSKFLRNSRLHQSSFIAQIGTYSYSIYLLHEPVRHLVASISGEFGLLFISSLATFGAAAVCHRLIEAPFIALGRKEVRLKSRPLSSDLTRPTGRLPKF